MSDDTFRNHLKDLETLHQRMCSVLGRLQEVHATVAETAINLERNASLSRLRAEAPWTGARREIFTRRYARRHMPVDRSSGDAMLHTLTAMPGTRIAKTFEKLRAGELPAPTGLTTFLASGLGTACNGCGERIGQSERSYCVRVGDRTLLRFHVVCHETWMRFKRQP